MQDVGEVQVPDNPFEEMVLEEMRDRPRDGTDHFCSYVASELRELDERTRMRTAIKIMQVLREARWPEDSQ